MLTIKFEAGVVRAGDSAALRCGSAYTKMIRLRLRNTIILVIMFTISNYLMERFG
jgi:hypothetical protein